MASNNIDNLLGELDKVINKANKLSGESFGVTNLGEEYHNASLAYIATELKNFKSTIKNAYAAEEKKKIEENLKYNTFNKPTNLAPGSKPNNSFNNKGNGN